MSPLLMIAGAVLVSLLSLVLHVAFYSPISPLPLSLPSSSLTILHNNLLQGVDKLGEGLLLGPEDVLVGGDGTAYAVTRDGWIKRMLPNSNGSWDDWQLVGGPGLLGITQSMDGHLLVCDAHKGLIKVGDNGVTILASHVDGIQIRFADDAIEASDGIVYFSDASTKFGFQEWFLDVLEARPNGRLLKYDPSTKKASVVLADLCFANGVALSPTQDFLIVCETCRFRCMKYWLKGEKKGELEVFIDNLPGGPDNINLAPDGSYWIALLQLRSDVLDLIHRTPAAKRVIAAFPKLIEAINPVRSRAMAVNVAADGTIRRTVADSNGRVMSFVTSAFEFEGHLYLGSLSTDFVGRLLL